MLDRVVILFVVALLLGPLINARIGVPGLLQPGSGTNTFFVQYREHEPIFLGLLAAFLVLTAFLARRQAPSGTAPSVQWPVPRSERMWLGIVACAVLLVTGVGTFVVMHALPLSMDEFVATYQSKLLASGGLSVAVPRDWQWLAASLTPVYVALDPERLTWTPQYLPLYAALRAPFVGLGLDRFVNPGLPARSVMLLHI
jgi:hypothetical protein